MKKILSLLFFLGFLSYSAFALADVDCFKYYEFQTGLLFKDMITEKTSYAPGDTVVISFAPLSQMDAPVVEGSVLLQVFYNDESDGEQMLDEFFAAKDINLMKGGIIKEKYSWTLSKNAKSGTYTVKAYFIVGKTFNLAGLSVLPYGPPGVPGELTTFEVKGGTPSRIYYSKKDTTVNGEAYEFAAPVKVRDKGDISVKTKIVNEGPAKKVNLYLQTFEWADVTGVPIAADTFEGVIDLPENGAEDVSYNVSGLAPATYEIKLSAQSGDETSIMKLRMPVTGIKGRLIYLGADSFPLKKGQPATLFACYSGSSDYSTIFNGSLDIEVLDDKGTVIYKESGGPFEVLSTPPQAKTASFTPQVDMNYMTVVATLYDDKNNIQDTQTVTYDYSRFKGIPAGLTLASPKASYAPGDPIPYKVEYKDDKGTALTGKIVVYLTNEENRIVDAATDVSIAGEYSGEFKGQPDGKYKITARELTQDKKAEDLITVEEQKAPSATTSTVQETTPTTSTTETAPPNAKDNGNSVYWPLIGGLVLLVAIFLLIRMRRSGK